MVILCENINLYNKAIDYTAQKLQKFTHLNSYDWSTILIQEGFD